MIKRTLSELAKALTIIFVMTGLVVLVIANNLIEEFNLSENMSNGLYGTSLILIVYGFLLTFLIMRTEIYYCNICRNTIDTEITPFTKDCFQSDTKHYHINCYIEENFEVTEGE